MSYDGGLRAQTPPTNRRGPQPSMGASKLLGSGQRHHGSGGDGGEGALHISTETTTSEQGQHCVYVPTVQYMEQLVQKHAPTEGGGGSPSRVGKPRRGGAAPASPNGGAGFRLASPSQQRQPQHEAGEGHPPITHTTVLQAVDLMVKFMGCIPRYAPLQALEALRILQEVVNNRSAVHTMLMEVVVDVKTLGQAQATMASRNAALEATLAKVTSERNAAVDLAVAADGQMLRLSDEIKALHDANKKLAAEFEKKVHAMTHKDIPQARTMAAEYRTAECARTERECDELRAQLAKRQGWLVERSALIEAAAREARARADLQQQLTAKEAAAVDLQGVVDACRAQVAALEGAHREERRALCEEIEVWRLQRANPRQSCIIARLMEERAVRSRLMDAWTTWSKVGQLSVHHKAILANTAEHQHRQVVLEGRQLMLKEEKAILMRQVTALTRQADDQMLRLQQLSAEAQHGQGRIAVPKQAAAAVAGQASLSERRAREVAAADDEHATALAAMIDSETHMRAAPTSLLDIARMEDERTKKPRHRIPQDPQVQAIKAYHMLSTVLHGIKRRLNLESLRIPPLPIAERSTDPVQQVVFEWIQEVFEFIHHIMSVEDRLLKAKVKLTFMNVQLKPGLKRIEAQIHFASNDASQVDVLRRQKEGYVEIQRAIKALKGHIDATAKALVSSTDPKKHEQIKLLTNTFEADVAIFMQRVEANRKMQFQFDVQLFHLREARADLVQRLVRGEDVGTSPTKGRQGGGGVPTSVASGGPQDRRAMLGHNMAPEGAGHTSPGMTTASPASSTPVPSAGLKRLASIGELLPTLKRFNSRPDSVGSWAPADTRPMTSEVLQNSAHDPAFVDRGRDTRGIDNALHDGGDDGFHAHASIPTAREPSVQQHDATPCADADDADAQGELHSDGDDDADGGDGGDPELEFIATEEGLQLASGQAAGAPRAQQPPTSNNAVTITRCVPSPDDLCGALVVQKKDRHNCAGSKVLDPWAERRKSSYRISSVLRAGADGKMDARDFLRLTKSTAAISESIRHSLDSELDMLTKAKARTRMHNASLLHQGTTSGSAGEPNSPATSKAQTTRSLNNSTPASLGGTAGGGGGGRCGSAAASESSQQSQQKPSAIPTRDNTQRPGVVVLTEHHLQLTSSEASDVLQKLLPRRLSGNP